MKLFARIVSLLLVFMLCFMLASCSTEEDVYERVRKHLEKEYPGMNFTVIDYEKRNETSGRYEINARCLDDGVEFKLFIYSSITVTDSYSVERANTMMETLVTTEIGEELSKKFKYVQWYDIYADRAENYRFREVSATEIFDLEDMKNIYEVRISESVKEAEIGGVIYDFMYSLCDEEADECDVETAEFVFKIGRLTYRFTTSSEAVLELGRDGVVFYVLKNIESSNSPFKDVEFEYFSADEMPETEEDAQEGTAGTQTPGKGFDPEENKGKDENKDNKDKDAR